MRDISDFHMKAFRQSMSTELDIGKTVEETIENYRSSLLDCVEHLIKKAFAHGHLAVDVSRKVDLGENKSGDIELFSISVRMSWEYWSQNFVVKIENDDEWWKEAHAS